MGPFGSWNQNRFFWYRLTIGLHVQEHEFCREICCKIIKKKSIPFLELGLAWAMPYHTRLGSKSNRLDFFPEWIEPSILAQWIIYFEISFLIRLIALKKNQSITEEFTNFLEKFCRTENFCGVLSIYSYVYITKEFVNFPNTCLMSSTASFLGISVVVTNPQIVYP